MVFVDEQTTRLTLCNNTYYSTLCRLLAVAFIMRAVHGVRVMLSHSFHVNIFIFAKSIRFKNYILSDDIKESS